MQAGDLVRWSLLWLDGCSVVAQYKDQIGIVSKRSEQLHYCFVIVWNSGKIDEVHYDYLEVLCK